MASIGIFRKLWFLRNARSVGERPLVRSILESKPRKILELGIGELERTPKMLSMVARISDVPIHYVGFDRLDRKSVV